MKNILHQYKKDVLLIVLLYTLAHGLMLVNEGIYWDDWTIFNVADSDILVSFTQGGYPLLGFMHVLLNEYPLLYRIITFISFLVSSLLLFCILTTIREIDAFDRLVIVLLFSLFPINFSKIAMINATPIVCLLFFMLGSYYLLRYVLEKKYVFHTFSLLFFIISFSIHSFLVFFSIPFLLIVYHERIYRDLPRSLSKFRKYIFYILLPFVFWFVRQIYFQPFGLFEGFYQLSLKHILLSPIFAVMTGYCNIIFLVIKIFYNSEYNIAEYWFFVLPICIHLYRRFKYKEIAAYNKNTKIMFALGLFSYFIAVFPYIALRRLDFGCIGGWHSRNQLLIPFSASIIWLYGIKIIFNELKINKKIAVLFLSLFISGSILSNAMNCLQFQRARLKQLSLIESFKNSDIIRNHTTFLIDDRLTYLNPFGSKYEYYEYTGLMKYVFGNEKRFAANYYGSKKSINAWLWMSKVKIEQLYPQYNFNNYVWKDPEYLVIIKPGRYKIDMYGTLTALVYRWLNKEEYRKKINNIVSLEYRRL